MLQHGQSHVTFEKFEAGDIKQKQQLGSLTFAKLDTAQPQLVNNYHDRTAATHYTKFIMKESIWDNKKL